MPVQCGAIYGFIHGKSMKSWFPEAYDITFKLWNTAISKFIESFIEEEKKTRMSSND
jgi:hypothetical protein